MNNYSSDCKAFMKTVFLVLFSFIVGILLLHIFSSVFEKESIIGKELQKKLPQNDLNNDSFDLSNLLSSSNCSPLNNDLPLLEVLNVISALPYFRYFKINSYKECPYWAVNLLCSSSENSCSVCRCDEQSIPRAFQTSYDMSNIKIPSSFISQSVPHPLNADSWGAWLGIEANNNDKGEYVDLLQNPEGNTGYSGPGASNVWRAIFQENCLPFEQKENCHAFKLPRVFFSGLHTSILIHVATNFYQDVELISPNRVAGLYNNPNISFFPNCDMFLSRIASQEKYIENLNILYLFVLKSIQLSRQSFLDDLSSYNSGENHEETVEDRNLKEHMIRLFEMKAIVSNCLQEKILTENAPANTSGEITFLLSNVTRLMDCVECQKCRIWGKLETKGLATALNIIFDRNKTMLDRAEKVTLINLAKQLLFALNSYYRLSNFCRENEFSAFN